MLHSPWYQPKCYSITELEDLAFRLTCILLAKGSPNFQTWKKNYAGSENHSPHEVKEK
jgi:hypothetical protein